ncbi:MAG: DUF4241 domain-containing protein [Sandaracinaceae bacterium]
MSDAPRWLDRLADGTLDEVKVVEGPTLKLPSGKLTACDPLVFLRTAEPFAHELEPGEYAVSVGRFGGDNAFARLRVTDQKVVRWAVARCPGEEDAEGWPGYSVDAGTGCFVDQSAIETFVKNDDAVYDQISDELAQAGILPSDPLTFHEAFAERRAELGGDPLSQLMETLLSKASAEAELVKGTANVVAFVSGAGDGIYASFWGYDAADQVVCLVTDFGLLEPDEDEEGDDDLVGEDEFDDLLDDEALSADDLMGLEALAAALTGGGKEEPEPEQGPSPLYIQTRALLQKWLDEEKIELEEDVNPDSFAEALLEKLVSLAGHRHPGAHVGEWLLERPEVADVYASDDDFQADLTR